MKHLKTFLLPILTGSMLAASGLEGTTVFRHPENLELPRTGEENAKEIPFTLPVPGVDKRAVLRFNAWIGHSSGGWNNTLRVDLNGTRLTEKTNSGEQRLLRRGMYLESRTKNPRRAWWSGSGLLVLFGDGNPENLDRRILAPRQEGYTYHLDITDLLRRGGNTLKFINSFRLGNDNDPHRDAALHVTDIAILFLQDIEVNAMRSAEPRKEPAAPCWKTGGTFIPFHSHPGRTFAPDEKDKQFTVEFPAMPRKKGFTPVLGCRFWLATPAPGGWNYHTGLLLNESKLDKMTVQGESRLLRRGAFMDTTLPKDPKRDWWREGQFVTFFGNGRDVDRRLKNGPEEGYNFLFDISDRVHYVEIGADNRIEKAETNRLTLLSSYSTERKKGALATASSVFQDIFIGYVPNAELEKMRPAETDSVANRSFGTRLFTLEGRGYLLDFHRNGGFVIRCDGMEYYVQDAFSFPGKGKMNFTEWNLADGKTPPEIRRNGGRVTIRQSNPFFRMERTVEVLGEQFHVTDEITNLSGADQGMRTRFITTARDPLNAPQTFLGGLLEKSIKDGMSGQNPSFFTQPLKGGSLGIYVADDLLRNQSGFHRTRRDLILDNPHLGFPASGPLAKKTLVRRFYPKAGATYFDFVNQVRRDLNLNRTMTGYFGFGSRPSKMPAVDHYALSQWFEWDANSRWTNREDYRIKKQAEMTRIKKAIPWAKCLARLESNILNIKRSSVPGGEKLPDGRRGKGGGVYGLELNDEQNAILRNSPFSDSLMRNAEGHAVVDTSYAHPGDLNLLVHFAEGNYRLKHVLEQIDYVLDVVGLDGVYLDQFVPGCDQELDNNKRCSYDKWDQLTVDLNPDGTIRRKIYDYINAGSSARAKIVKHVAAKGKLMYNNNHPVTMETNGLPSYSFCESGGPGTAMEVKHTAKPAIVRCHALAQLSGSPLTLGYQERTPKELSGKYYNRAVIVGLRHGVLYARYGLEPDPEFGGAFATDHMYPITPLELGEGFIIGKERIISCVSRKFMIRSAEKPQVLCGDENGRRKQAFHAPVTREGDAWVVDLKLKDWNEVAVILILPGGKR